MFFIKEKFASLPMTKAIMELKQDRSILLIDVRTPEEYAAGHIPNSKNIPLQQAEQIQTYFPDQDSRIFVYCLSGARSRSACGIFAKLGYHNITNIGGINAWNGSIERS